MVKVSVRSPCDLGMKVGLKKESPWLLDDQMRIILRSLVLTHYQRVTDGQTRCLCLQHGPN